MAKTKIYFSTMHEKVATNQVCIEMMHMDTKLHLDGLVPECRSVDCLAWRQDPEQPDHGWCGKVPQTYKWIDLEVED